MAANQFVGKDAFVLGVPCTQSWSASAAITAQRYAASCIPGATNTPSGVTNWSGTAAGIGAQPILFPTGLPVTFQGVVNNDAGQGDLLSLNGTILVEQLTIDINKEDGSPIKWSATFGFQGNPTESATGAADATIFNDPTSGSLLDIKIAAATIESVSVAVKKAQLVFRRPHATFPKNGSTERRAGNLEADINFDVSAPSQFVPAFNYNTLARVQVYTSATAYWDFSKIRFGAKSGLTVDRGTNTLLGYSVNGQFNGADGGVLGYIAYHNGTSPTDYFGDSTP